MTVTILGTRGRLLGMSSDNDSTADSFGSRVDDDSGIVDSDSDSNSDTFESGLDSDSHSVDSDGDSTADPFGS